MRIVALIITLICASAHAADYCVRSGATGARTGADWDNAYTNFPSLVRGNTYYVADGSYGIVTFDTAEDGTNAVRIKRATPAAHGPATGWSDGYSVTNALFREIYLQRPYFEIDGVTGFSNSTRGIKIIHSSGAGFGGIWADSWPEDRHHHYWIKSVEIMQTYPHINDALYFWLNRTNAASLSDPNLLVENCYIHNIGGLFGHVVGGNYQIWRNNWMELSAQLDSDGHKEMMKWDDTNSFIRIYGNTFKDWEGYTVTGGLILGGGDVVGYMQDWLIYNNVFWWTGRTNPGGTYAWGGGNRAIGGLGTWQTVHKDVHIFNNTFHGINGESAANLYEFHTNSINCSIQNNLFSDCAGLDAMSLTNNHNAFHNTVNRPERSGDDVSLGSSPFVNAATGDFRLQATSTAIGVGTNLNSYFQTDRNGTIRGSGAWDIGAYQHAAGQQIPPPGTNVAGTLISGRTGQRGMVGVR